MAVVRKERHTLARAVVGWPLRCLGGVDRKGAQVVMSARGLAEGHFFVLTHQTAAAVQEVDVVLVLQVAYFGARSVVSVVRSSTGSSQSMALIMTMLTMVVVVLLGPLVALRLELTGTRVRSTRVVAT